jgi:hypothetical protein
VVFSSLAFLVGRSLSGRQPVLNRLAVVQVWPETGRAKVNGLLGIFSPGREVFQVELPAQFLAHAIPENFSPPAAGGLNFIQTELGTTRLPDLRVDVGEVRSLALEGQAPAYPIDQDLALHIDDRGAVLRGSLTNQGDQVLQGAVLLAPGKTQHYGNLNPGQVQEIGLGLDTASQAAYSGGADPRFGPVPRGVPGPTWDVLLGTNDFYRDRQTYQRFTLLNALTGYAAPGSAGDGITFAAWSDGSPLSASLDGKQTLTSSTTLYLVALQPRLSLSPGRLSLPPGLFTWSVLTPGAMGEAAPYDTMVSPGGFGLRFEPVIAFPDRPVRSLTLRLSSYGATGRAGVAVQLWNYPTGGWEELPGLNWGETPIPNPAGYVGPGGEIRLRLDNQDSFGPVQVESADFVLELEEVTHGRDY